MEVEHQEWTPLQKDENILGFGKSVHATLVSVLKTFELCSM